ncbi:MAG TPA: WhiB family transcriptional regulator [Streptosporangiaceae bacterium]|nr:WhiB family transcriptional regulator [Streptosporangiaceae bacterium]
MSHYTGSVPDSEPAGQWMKRAACLGRNDEMFPENNEVGIARAKAICAACPVQEPCLQAALGEEGDAAAGNRFGIRGGQTKGQRRRAYEKGHTAAEVLRRYRLRTAPDEDVLRDLYDRHTAPTGDGHLVWTGTYPLVSVRDHKYTVGQLAFQVGHGREPEGIVRRTCDRDQCVDPTHLQDGQIRATRKADAA